MKRKLHPWTTLIAGIVSGGMLIICGCYARSYLVPVCANIFRCESGDPHQRIGTLLTIGGIIVIGFTALLAVSVWIHRAMNRAAPAPSAGGIYISIMVAPATSILPAGASGESGSSETAPDRAASLAMVQPSSEFACPQCHMTDKVQKVSALVQSGEGMSSLLLPSEPKYVSRNNEVVLLYVAASVLLVAALFVLIYELWETYSGAKHVNNVAAAVALGVVGMLFSVWGLIRHKQDAGNQRAYKDKKARWNTAYFCHRDGVVYIRGDPRVASPHDLRQLLTTPP